MNMDTRTGTTELDATEARDTTGGSLWTWLFGEPKTSTTFGGGSFGGGGAGGSW